MDMETLQQNFAILSEVYDSVHDLYMTDGITQDDDIESLLSEAEEIIDEMGDLEESDFSDESEMEELNESMVTLIEALGDIVDGMTIEE